MLTATRKITMDEFLTHYDGQAVELIQGEVIDMPPAGFEVSEIAALILAALATWVYPRRLGRLTGADGGYILSPDTVRAPDVGYFSNVKSVLIVDPSKHLPFPPDLAVEVVSPNDRPTDVIDKVNLYLRVGVLQVWVVYPTLKLAYIYYPDGTARRVEAHQSLMGGDVLPGFDLPLITLFPADLPDAP
jgi:Uma2 family endonuclease